MSSPKSFLSSLLQQTWIWRVATISIFLALTGSLIQHLGIIPVRYRSHTHTCMGELGCFSIDGEFSARLFNVLPQSREDIDTHFVIYTAETKVPYQYSELSSLTSSLDINKGLIVVIHGWVTVRTEPLIHMLMSSLVETKSHTHNILLVDWWKGSMQPYYLSASNTRVVAAEIVRFIKHLQTLKPDVLAGLHLIGISLGAHISGYCGSALPGISRITALDAAGPLFEHYHPSVRLDPSDAEFVDAIHTDGDDFYETILADGGLGIDHSIGHADFYPNGGLDQPYCEDIISRILFNPDTFTATILRAIFACDHRLALVYFSKSLYSPLYLGYVCHTGHDGYLQGRCYDTNYMGYDAKKISETGANYYLQTTEQESFNGSHYHISFEADLDIDLNTHLSLQLTGSEGFTLVTSPHQSCSSCKVRTAMMFSANSIGRIVTLNVAYHEIPANEEGSRPWILSNVVIQSHDHTGLQSTCLKGEVLQLAHSANLSLPISAAASCEEEVEKRLQDITNLV